MTRNYKIIDKELEQRYNILVTIGSDKVFLNRSLITITLPHKETVVRGVRFHVIPETRFDKHFEFDSIEQLMKELGDALSEIKEDNPRSELAKKILEMPKNLESKRKESNRSIMSDRLSRR